jgi:hypothetical protein
LHQPDGQRNWPARLDFWVWRVHLYSRARGSWHENEIHGDLVAVALAGAMFCGCATNALWSDANLGTWHEPVTNSPVRMFHDGQSGELLVLYEEASSHHHQVRTRAYLLYKNEGRIERQAHPAFVKTDVARHLEPIPVFPNAAAAAAPLTPIYAVLSTNQLCFTVYSSGASVGLYELPVYYDGFGKVERLALTPLAVTADLSIVGGAVAYLIFAYSPESTAETLNSIKIR